MVVIPWQELSADALTGLIEAFVLREGTDYGPGQGAAAPGPSLETKRAAVQRQLEAGTAVIVYHAELELIDIRLASEMPSQPS